ncbi:SDR family oxidoreductase [Shinella yambaruensis]|uniref:Short chain dehydrogenase n=1 Tax=Shinella yambaruensis TaxID=415996 RepID=A0ABQ5ZFX7_9HYPH|nr:SDR family oxidoreductase [Shinella yambaruensis]MCJ8024484.1 SDR family oxidoreductase [Shinella yambaruensis]MCU7980926.1 SDR family oxidoreductase [Shinella yambaruensis]GLR49788.1 short chain dehydrogenase [Shinella yambaruensis]
MNKPPRTALVTGGAKRIGKAIVEDLVAHGFAVAIHANTSLEDAEAMARAFNAGGGSTVAVQCDLADGAATSRLIGTAADALGPIGLLVNNASLFKPDTVEAFDDALWERHFAVHVKAPSILARDFVRQLPEGAPGSIVNIIDQRVWNPTPRYYSYTLSKSALWMATRTMAQSFAPRVRVNAIGPGPSLPNERQDEAAFQAQVEGLILRRGPGLDEFGRTVRFLFDTPSITGQMIALDGGQHLAWETPDVGGIAE